MKKTILISLIILICATLYVSIFNLLPQIKHHFIQPYIVFRENICFNKNATTARSSYSMETYQAIKNGNAQSEARPNDEIQFGDFIDFNNSVFDSVSFASISPRNFETGMQPVPIDTSRIGDSFLHTIYYSYGDGRYSTEFSYAVREDCSL